jgi:adenine-specific DNA-methyltransferase
MSRRYDEFRNVLRELFQLDQADLDFGIYRIMAVKRAEIERFLDQDLLPQVRQSLAKYQPALKTELEQTLETMVTTLRAAGMNPEDAPKVKELREQAAKATDLDALEDEIFSHLVTFFRRYYKEGDFISQRRYKEDAYAIPYNGEEVKLYWANHDQYYVKSADYLTTYAFRTGDGAGPRVRFELVAAEVERDNNKPQPDKERRFLLHEADPVAVECDSTNGTDETLVIRFEYRPDSENRKQDKINEATETTILEAAPATWQARLALKAPTEANPQRTLLGKHLDGFTKRNTFDFFIHKDLGKFLRRELDFFIKNEIVYLDDLVDVNDAVIKQQLSKAIVLREIAHKLIDFLAQVENFQKKLWLKKKFVVETHYCITLDRVPRHLYAEIAANDRQREEWVRLFAINEIEPSTVNPGYSQPLTEDFLAANPNLVVDTRLFNCDFTECLLEALDELDGQCDGLLIHSENFQALNLLQERYREQVQCIFIDPPYNTSASEITYKNGYKSSSWLSLVNGRIRVADTIFSSRGIMCITIDDFEFHRLRLLVEEIYSKESFRGVVSIKSNPSGRSTAKGFSIAHEYGIYLTKDEEISIGRLSHSEQQLARYKLKDEVGAFEWTNFRKHGGANANRWARPKLYYPIFVSKDSLRFPNTQWNAQTNSWDLLDTPSEDERILFPVTSDGDEKTWKWGLETAKSNPSEFSVRRDQDGELGVYRKSRLNEAGTLPLTVWDKSIYSSTEYGTNLLKKLFGESETFSFPKSVFTVMDSLRTCNASIDSLTLDYFAGSGTTGHAVINLNREDGGNRKYILVEMGEYFDTVLKPRILKVVYSPDWRDGKPTSRDQGASQLIKVLRLESYEDTLDNLEFTQSPAQQWLLDEGNRNDPFREAYLLHYMLELESRESPSLLNIQAFANPFDYRLKVTRNHEQQTVAVDLVETFNYLIGLRVQTLSARLHLAAEFARDQHKRLAVTRTRACAPGEGWSFRRVEGQTPQGQKALIIWRTLSGNPEKDNALLDHYFERMAYSTRDREFDVIYVNGDNNLENLRRDDETWKVRLIEVDFHRLMFDVQDV